MADQIAASRGSRPLGVSVLGWLFGALAPLAFVQAILIYVIRSWMQEMGLWRVDLDLLGSAQPMVAVMTAPAWALAGFQFVLGVVFAGLGWGLLKMKPVARTATQAISIVAIVGSVLYLVWFGQIWMDLAGTSGAPRGFEFVSVVMLVMGGAVSVSVPGVIVWYLRLPDTLRAFERPSSAAKPAPG